MNVQITGALFKQMMLHGAAAITLHKQSINDLNVFPVPDGDTGTNMSLTIQTAASELRAIEPETIDKAASVTASALLRGARGNSGVILSLLFRGISKSLKGKETATACEFAAAMQEGVAAAYSAVMKPAEGTVLTVSRLAADRAMHAAEETDDVDAVLASAIEQGSKTLAETIEMNPVLKKAGVVDAGGKGYLLILQGMLDALRGEPLPEVEDDGETQGKADFASLTDEDITFTYDTVFIVRKTTNGSIEPLRAYLDGIGDSLVIGEDDDAFKVHVHTDVPGDVLNEAQKYGTLEIGKIENMRMQYEDMAAGRKTKSADDLTDEDADEAPSIGGDKRLGFIAVCAGDGLAEVFRDLGVDGIISGGQTMNPSTESILTQIKNSPADVVFVLPNNKNIIMAAQQCVGLTEKRVIVIPTATVPQGITAMMNVDPNMDVEAIEAAMVEAISTVSTAQITYAARDSDFDGFAIKEGDYLSLLDGRLFDTSRDIKVLLHNLAEQARDSKSEFVSIFYGEDVSADDAKAAEAVFAELCPDAEITMLHGGQPVYYYIVSME
ncbi:MAG: DAK2 domain-containing protein [Oscillospiraceae bacterium]|nr:DAK2 domain-containing protein [Oscillospiraceae bacterium]